MIEPDKYNCVLCGKRSGEGDNRKQFYTIAFHDCPAISYVGIKNRNKKSRIIKK
jgi:hypothetical protein